MSYFRDNTPHEKLLGLLDSFKVEYHLTDLEMIVLLAQVMSGLFDPGDDLSNKLKNRKSAWE